LTGPSGCVGRRSAAQRGAAAGELMDHFALQWVQLNGGPLLVLAEDLLPLWEGADAPAPYRTIEPQSRWNPSVPPWIMTAPAM